MNGPARGRRSTDPLDFFPGRRVSSQEVRRILRQGTDEERSWVISHLLRYAQWDDIWAFVSREEILEVFPSLDLPENLRQAWGRMLKIEAPAGSP